MAGATVLDLDGQHHLRLAPRRRLVTAALHLT